MKINFCSRHGLREGDKWRGHVCSQLVHWFAAESCLEILSNCRLSVLRVLNLLRNFRFLDDLLYHLWFLRFDGLFNDFFTFSFSTIRSEARSCGITLTRAARESHRRSAPLCVVNVDLFDHFLRLFIREFLTHILRP